MMYSTLSPVTKKELYAIYKVLFLLLILAIWGMASLFQGVPSLIVSHIAKPIPQPESYHNFADTTTFFGIPNGLNVLSNIPFLLGGLYGLLVLQSLQSQKNVDRTVFKYGPGKNAYYVLFSSMCFVAIGSGYYHWWPTTTTLFWDRLPMTIAFMAIISIILTEKVNARIGHLLLYPLIGVGIFSVIWWIYTELHPDRIGDLRLYFLVQATPVLLTPIIVSVYPDQYSHTGYMYITTGLYVAAKFAELFDHQIYVLTFHVLSGHTLKHVLAAIGPVLLAVMLAKRNHLASD